MEKKLVEIEKQLNVICDQFNNHEVSHAMKYSLLAGGKRIRPLLFLQLLDAYGIEWKNYITIACAIEMIHTYSLIHDDLPCMDNDDLRRGKPTCHIQFDEPTALLAGDGLLNEAVLFVLGCDIDPMIKNECAIILYKASGIQGMIHGQNMDMMFENKHATLAELEHIHLNKTGALISASLEMASLIAKNNERPISRELGYKLGLAFQIQDDILDVTSTSLSLGKTIGSDLENNKSTYVSLLGLQKSNQRVYDLFVEIQCLVDALSIDRNLFLKVIEKIKERVN